MTSQAHRQMKTIRQNDNKILDNLQTHIMYGLKTENRRLSTKINKITGKTPFRITGRSNER